jgi:hypothetical protein
MKGANLVSNNICQVNNLIAASLAANVAANALVR